MLLVCSILAIDFEFQSRLSFTQLTAGLHIARLPLAMWLKHAAARAREKGESVGRSVAVQSASPFGRRVLFRALLLSIVFPL